MTSPNIDVPARIYGWSIRSWAFRFKSGGPSNLRMTKQHIIDDSKTFFLDFLRRLNNIVLFICFSLFIFYYLVRNRVLGTVSAHNHHHMGRSPSRAIGFFDMLFLCWRSRNLSVNSDYRSQIGDGKPHQKWPPTR